MSPSHETPPLSDRIPPTISARLIRFWPWLFLLLFTLVVVLGTVGIQKVKSEQRTNETNVRSATDTFLESLHEGAMLLSGESAEASELYPSEVRVPWQLHLARMLAVIFVLGALVVIVWPQLEEPLRRTRIYGWELLQGREIRLGPLGKFRLRRIRPKQTGYTVVCGLGWTGYEIARSIRQQKKGCRRLIVIDKDPDNPFSEGLTEAGGVIHITGDATRPEILESAGVRWAHRIYVAADSDEINCRVATQLASVLDSGSSDKPGKEHKISKGQPGIGPNIPAYVQITDPGIRAHLENVTRASRLDVRCFDPFRITARHLLARHSPFAFPQSEPVHFVVAGQTPLAEAILIELLHQGHWLDGRDVRFTVLVDCDEAEDAEHRLVRSRKSFFRRHPFLLPELREASPGIAALIQDLYPHLGPREDLIEFQPIPFSGMALRDEGFILHSEIRAGKRVYCYLCLDDGVRSAALADILSEVLEYHDPEHRGALYRYYNYPEREPSCSPELPLTSRCVTFGSGLEGDAEGVVADSFIETAAMHLNAAFDGVIPSPGIVASASNESTLIDRSWNQAAEWVRESNRQAVAHLLAKLRLIGIGIEWENRQRPIGPRLSPESVLGVQRLRKTLESIGGPNADRSETENQSETVLHQIDALARMEHRRWCAERLLNGWMPLPTDMSLQAQWEQNPRHLKNHRHFHACLVPFKQLPMEERNKDYDQIRILLRYLDSFIASTRD